MPNSNFKVVIPYSVVDLLDLAAKVYKKHLQMGNTSPLETMKSNRWDSNGPAIEKAMALQKQAEELKRQMESVYSQRDLLVASVRESVRASRDVLLGISRDNPKELGEWGYEVNDSKRKNRKSKDNE